MLNLHGNVPFFLIASQVMISLQFATYTTLESEAEVEVCVSIEGGDVPPGGGAQYRLQTVDRSAVGKLRLWLHGSKQWVGTI